MSILKYYTLPIIAGIFIGTSFIPFQPWSLFFCLVPLFIFWSNAKTARETFIAGWIAQFILNLIGFHWIYSLAAEFGHFPSWLAFLTLIGFAATAHLYFAFAGLIWFYVNQRLKPTPARSIFLMFAIFALLQKYFLVLFPWHFGYEWLFGNIKGYQLADYVGFEGLNIIAIFINALFTLAYLWRLDGLKKFWRTLLAPMAIILFMNVLGSIHEKNLPLPDQHLKVLAVQGNIGNFEKIYAEKGRGFRESIMNRYFDLTEKALAANPGSELVVWPESALADHLDNFYLREPRSQAVRNFTRKNKIDLFTGAYHEDPRTRLVYNSLFLVDHNGEVTQTPYDKNILLAFGEYVPFSKYFPQVLKWLDLVEFGRGIGSHVMVARDIKFGPQICYEGLYASISRDLSQIGSEIIINVTNDSWYGQLFEPYQHMYITAGRAVEFRRPLIRATNTGVTSVILADGTFLEKSPTFKEWSYLYDVPYIKNPEHTFYEKMFYMWDILLGIGILYIIFSSMFSGQTESKRARV